MIIEVFFTDISRIWKKESITIRGNHLIIKWLMQILVPYGKTSLSTFLLSAINICVHGNQLCRSIMDFFSISQSGEKVLVLKKRYRDGATVASTPSRGVDIQERGPRVEMQRPKAKIRKTFEATPTRPDSPPTRLPAAAAVAQLPSPEELSQTARLPDESMEAVTPMDQSGASSMQGKDRRGLVTSICILCSQIVITRLSFYEILVHQ